MDCTEGINTSTSMFTFSVRHALARRGPRIGELVLSDRPPIVTPSFVTVTSRGVVPHITSDIVQKHTNIGATYVGLEDFIERTVKDAPIFKFPPEHDPQNSILRAFIGLPDRCIAFLGPRRLPSIETSGPNTNTSLAISTSVGFAMLNEEEYTQAARLLRPDAFTTLVDIPQAERISKKRWEKSVDRTHAWLRDTVSEAERLPTSTPILASLPPLEPEQQSFLLADLVDEYQHHVWGISVYDPSTAVAVPDAVRRLPILCFSDPTGPHDILTAVALGVDLITTPFVNATSEGGIALTFNFLDTANQKGSVLGIDMWSISHATDTSPLSPSCTCYTCTRHHRAYLYHLLQAKEMLAWTLLQIHNFHVVDRFFEQIRDSIVKDTFEEDSKAFRAAYDSEMPRPSGTGPRSRGYQSRNKEAGAPKRNPKAYGRLEEQARKLRGAESGVATTSPDDTADVLEGQGLGQQL